MDCYWREVLHPVEAGEGRAGPEWLLSSGSGVLTSICSQPEEGFDKRNCKRVVKEVNVMTINELMRMIQTSVQPS